MMRRPRTGTGCQHNVVRRLTLVVALLLVGLFFGPSVAFATEPAANGPEETEATVGNASLVAGLVLVGGWVGSGAWWLARHRRHSRHTVVRAASAEPSARRDHVEAQTDEGIQAAGPAQKP